MEQQTNNAQQENQPQTNSSVGNETSQTAETPAKPKTKIAKLKNKFLLGTKITLLISLIFYLAMFIIGCMGVHKCPVNDNIPLFLIATGGIGFFSKVVSIIRTTIMPKFKIEIVESSLYTAETVFLILGSYWVFKEYQPSFNENDRNYCQKTVYMFAFIYLAVLYAIVIAIILGFMCFLGCLIFVTKTAADAEDPEAQVRIQTEETREYGTTPTPTT